MNAAHTLDHLPEWLASNTKSRIDGATDLVVSTANRKDRTELQRAQFEAIFETALDRIAGGTDVKEIFEHDHRGLDFARFVAWVRNNPDRYERWKEAQRTAAEILFVRLPSMADGTTGAQDGIPEDVQRSTLKVTTARWMMGVMHRERFGEVKQVEMNTTIRLHSALQQARERALVGVVVEDIQRGSDDAEADL